MKKYKILKKDRDVYKSPFQNFYYGKLEEFVGKKMICDNFDESPIECSDGFYATDIDGLIYTNLSNGKAVFEVEVDGRSVVSNNFKQRFEFQTFIRELSIEEVKELIKAESDKMDWDYYSMLFPKNPLKNLTKVSKKHIKLLKKWNLVRGSVWNSVRDSVGYSVWNSVWNSVRDSVGYSVGYSVWNSVWNSVEDSVEDSVRGFISSGFPNIKKWKYIDHEEGKNPFQSCIDLWNDNLVPSFDGKTWRLHSGKKAEIVYEISKEELEKYE